ncbi:MAG: cohesin domain-containing protein [Candidatus Paceibacterota bacterium]|jgi:hypothetical protein|nr:cohesin domain-containing protein [Candidatus Paceibacterota bacterium]
MKIFSLFISTFFIFLSAVFPSLASGNAALFLSPTRGSYPIGEAFTVFVNINTNGEKISMAEGSVTFSNSELEVVELSKEDSILTSWNTEPSFSNEEGVVRFEGLTAAGYTGTEGKILSITFKALKNKESTVRFSTGAAIIAADGAGTNILTSMDAGKYELTPKEVIPELESVATSTPEESSSSDSQASTTDPAPAVPFELVSPTHPDQTRSYATSSAAFEWKWEGNISSVAFSLDTKPTTTPKKVYASPITEKRFKDLSEGVSYFHFQRNETNGSSTLIHYRVGIDLTPPDHFDITENKEITDAYAFNFDASDKISGIEKYVVKIDTGTENTWADDGSHIYRSAGLKPGAHALKAKALDAAGNFVEQSFSFTAPVTGAPSFVEKPKSVVVDEPFILRLKAPSAAKVRVIVETDKGGKQEGEAVKGSDGIFSYTVAEHAVKGAYTVKAVSSIKGVESEPSETIAIISKGNIAYYAKAAFVFLKKQSAKIFIAVLALLALFYGWSAIKRKRGEEEVEDDPEIPLSANKEVLPVAKTSPAVAERSAANSFQVVIGKRP